MTLSASWSTIHACRRDAASIRTAISAGDGGSVSKLIAVSVTYGA